jgi:hypothetical protein
MFQYRARSVNRRRREGQQRQILHEALSGQRGPCALRRSEAVGPSEQTQHFRPDQWRGVEPATPDVAEHPQSYRK